MLSFRESKSFLWYTSESDELGRGSFGIVYRGINKLTGDPVAVKLPHSNVTIPEEIESREIEVCKRINHKNIVQLLGYEEETYTRRERPKKVLIMELCDGGSLYKILEHPKNHFGLEEQEFLTVLRDLTAAMEYLRSNDIIHRDLKPANIMRCIQDDGSSVYKITDFGAARELRENQEYSSIFGTEEYLHPDVYEQALLPDSHIPNKKFSPSTDLWSIGATLYHVATGMLPFRPVGGRKNRRIMHLMTTKKESGVISAYQDRVSEKIVFEKQLPKNCLLSPGLKGIICPLLAGLMEVDPRKKLSFETYFSKVREINGLKVLHLFLFNRLSLVKVYVDKRINSWDEFSKLIEFHTGVLVQDQVLLFKNTVLHEITGDTGIWSKLPNTTECAPVILASRSNSEVTMKHDKMIFKKKLFPNTIEYNKDADIATHNCLVAHVIKRMIYSAYLRVKLTYESVSVINNVVVDQLTNVSKNNEVVSKSLELISNQFSMMGSFDNICREFGKIVPEDVERGGFHDKVSGVRSVYGALVEEFRALDLMLKGLRPSIDALVGSRVRGRFLVMAWEEACSTVKSEPDFLRIKRICDTLTQCVDALYLEFTGNVVGSPKSRRAVPLPEEECLHLIDRTKLTQTITKLEALQLETTSNATSLTCVIGDWYKRALTAYIQPEILNNDIAKLQTSVEALEQKVTVAVQEFNVKLAGISSEIRVIGRGSQRKNDKAKAVRDRLHELVRVQNETQCKFRVNFELCDQLQGLLMKESGEA